MGGYKVWSTSADPAEPRHANPSGKSTDYSFTTKPVLSTKPMKESAELIRSDAMRNLLQISERAFKPLFLNCRLFYQAMM